MKKFEAKPSQIAKPGSIVKWPESTQRPVTSQFDRSESKIPWLLKPTANSLIWASYNRPVS